MIDFSFYIPQTYLWTYLYIWLLYLTFIYLILPTEIICLNIFSKFLSFVYVTFKLTILSNHAEHSKRLAPYYTLPPFIILKSLYLTGQPARLERWLQFKEEIVLHIKAGPLKFLPIYHSLGQTMKTTKTLWDQTNLNPQRLLLDLFRLFFLLARILVLTNIVNRI